MRASKLLSFLLIISILLLANSGSVLAQGKKASETNAVYKVIPTAEEIKKYAEKSGWPISEQSEYEVLSTAFSNEYDLIKSERG